MCYLFKLNWCIKSDTFKISTKKWLNDNLEVAHLQSDSSWTISERTGITKCWFWGNGKNGIPRKKASRSKSENQQQTRVRFGVTSGVRTQATLEGCECSHHWILCLPCFFFYLAKLVIWWCRFLIANLSLSWWTTSCAVGYRHFWNVCVFFFIAELSDPFNEPLFEKVFRSVKDLKSSVTAIRKTLQNKTAGGTEGKNT